MTHPRIRLVRLAGLAAVSLLSQSISPAADPATVQGSRSWNFRIYLNAEPIGYHDFTLTAHGDRRELRSVAHFQVKILFIRAYHYDHSDTELWRGDCLERLDSSSDDDGKAYSVHARDEAGTLSVDAPPDHYALSGCIMTFAYWNPLMLQQSRLINPETGEDVAVSIAAVGDEDIQVRGVSVHARHYHLHSAKLEIDLWYSPDGDWLALESPSEKGRRLRYVLD